ncbi:ferritin family protein [Candidatus Sumerlaeota bacterium]|nr:ferritin family protein [Candidatus Sumerlaeota bacterium]
MALDSVEEILDFAIREEERARDFYRELAARMERKWMRDALEEFAREEEGHRTKLLAVKEGKVLQPSAEKVLDLRIADYLVDVPVGPDFDYQQALVTAMKKEKAAFRLYSDLERRTSDPDLQSTFRALAQEEARHKLRFELEYDEHVLEWN